MTRRLREQRGQLAAEYAGVLLIVALIVSALVAINVHGRIAGGVQQAVCSIAGTACPETADARTERARTPATADDGDGDGVSDARERELGLDPHSADADGDGLPDGKEIELGADPRNPDTDGDGVSDADEADSGGAMRPNDADTDDDGLTDAEELAVGSDPSQADSDDGGGQLGDGLTDAEEIEHGTDPNLFDTDGDGWSDGYEVEHGGDPTRDERNLLEKARDMFLDDPFTLGKGALIKGAGKKVVDDLLAKGGKAARKIGDAKSIKEAARIRRERLNALRYRLRGAPQGLSREQFDQLGTRVRAGAGQYGDDIRVHGSRASGTARPGSDIDVAIRVPPERFDEILRERFKAPNAGSARERTMQHAAETGKIQSGELGLRALRRELERELGKQVDISVIRAGGKFDTGPWVDVP
jgi:hypothetical protein